MLSSSLPGSRLRWKPCAALPVMNIPGEVDHDSL
jgi:hypothetical protein